LVKRNPDPAFVAEVRIATRCHPRGP